METIFSSEDSEKASKKVSETSFFCMFSVQLYISKHDFARIHFNKYSMRSISFDHMCRTFFCAFNHENHMRCKLEVQVLLIIYDCPSLLIAQIWTSFHYHQCTMCILGSMFSFQPNTLRHILKFISWYSTYICPNLFGWKENLIFKETVTFKL